MRFTYLLNYRRSFNLLPAETKRNFPENIIISIYLDREKWRIPARGFIYPAVTKKLLSLKPNELATSNLRGQTNVMFGVQFKTTYFLRHYRDFFEWQMKF